MTEDPNINQIDDERVRDHLANERTYLAWLRTGVSSMGFGVVIAKFKYFAGGSGPESYGNINASNLGLLFALAGIATIIMSIFFFLENRRLIRMRKYRAKIWLAILLGGATIALGVIVIWHLSHLVALGAN